MSVNEKLLALSQRLNAASNEIAADLKSLRDKIAENSANDEVIAGLDAQISRIEALGADDENPVPDAPVTDAPTTEAEA